MGKKGKRGKKDFKPSSGLRVMRDRNRRIRRLKMKVARWERNKEKGKPVSENAKGLSRYEWDTTGLKKQIAFLESL